MPKTVTLAHGSKMAISGGQQIYNTSTGQILTLPASNILGGQGGKPFTLQMAGGGQKTLTLVQAPNQTTSSPQVIVQSSSGPAPTITTSHEGPVSSDAALAQLAAEAGLLEGGDGSMIQVNH
jgi:host cell factor